LYNGEFSAINSEWVLFVVLDKHFVQLMRPVGDKILLSSPFF